MTASKTNRVFRYLAVNVTSGVADYGVLLALIHFFNAPVLASVVAYSVAMLVNFKLSKAFVFTGATAHKSDERVFLEFVASGLLGLALTAAVFWINVHFVDAAPAVAKTAAVAICLVVLYFVRSRLVFDEARPGALAAA